MVEHNPINDLLMAPAKAAALYMLTFPNGKRYIGVSTNPKKRLRRHKAFALGGSACVVHRAMRKFGMAAVRQDILLVGPRDFVLEMEAKAIAAFDTANYAVGYNMTPGGIANPMDDPIARAKIIQKLTGRKDSEETRAKKRASWTPERRAAVSAVHKGKVISEEQKALTRMVKARKRQ